MTKQEFSQYIKEKRSVFLDGATGSNLQKAGMPSGICPEQWIAENPEPLQKLQKAYAEAGSNIIYAPTFGANRIKLAEYGLEKETVSLNKKLVQITKEAVGPDVLVAGDLTMTGQQLEPLGMLSLEELTDVYREQAAALAEAGADLLVVETMLSLAETRAALMGAREACSLPVMVTMSFGESGKTLYGTDPATAVLVLQGLGADAVGVNCGLGPDKLGQVVAEMAQYAKVPLIAKPNAGLPKLGADGTTVYDMEAEDFAEAMKGLVEAGASLLGGCCGTGPDYIRTLVSRLQGFSSVKGQPEEKENEDEYWLTTERLVFPVEDSLQIGMVDSAENEELAEDYRNGMTDTLLDLLEEQFDEESDIICLSVDGEGIDGCGIIQDVVGEAAQMVNLPLAFSSEDPEVLEKALRAYPGLGGIVPKPSNDKEILARLCEQYGAVLLSR